MLLTTCSMIQDFPWGANPKGGANLLFDQNFRKLHENEENWTEGEASKILLCRSATT